MLLLLNSVDDLIV